MKQEPLSLLKSTLQQLAEHKTAAERYVVVLAMEAAEEGHDAKAQKLKSEFHGRYRASPASLINSRACC
jgi:hypothetical protein